MLRRSLYGGEGHGSRHVSGFECGGRREPLAAADAGEGEGIGAHFIRQADLHYAFLFSQRFHRCKYP